MKVNGVVQEQLPSWPIFETLVIATVVIGAIYYVAAQRGRLDVVHIEADKATGEEMIA